MLEIFDEILIFLLKGKSCHVRHVEMLLQSTADSPVVTLCECLLGIFNIWRASLTATALACPPSLLLTYLAGLGTTQSVSSVVWPALNVKQ